MWTGLRFCNALKEAENKIKWSERVAMSVAPQRSPWLWDTQCKVQGRRDSFLVRMISSIGSQPDLVTNKAELS